MIKVVYPLLHIKTKEESGLYTMTCYDKYKHNKLKYIRGNPLFFTDKAHSKYKSIKEIPKTIEDDETISEWQFSYNVSSKHVSSVDYIAGVISYSMLTKK